MDEVVERNFLCLLGEKETNFYIKEVHFSPHVTVFIRDFENYCSEIDSYILVSNFLGHIVQKIREHGDFIF